MNSHASCFIRAQVMSSADNSCALAAEVNASRIVNFDVKAFNVRPSNGWRSAKYDNTFDTDYVEHNFG